MTSTSTDEPNSVDTLRAVALLRHLPRNVVASDRLVLVLVAAYPDAAPGEIGRMAGNISAVRVEQVIRRMLKLGVLVRLDHGPVEGIRAKRRRLAELSDRA